MAKPSGVTITKDAWPSFAAGVKALSHSALYAGIPAETTDRRPDAGEAVALNNAQIGYIQEHGSPANNLPARPWLVPGIQSVQKDITARLQATAIAAIEGGSGAVLKGLTATGLIAQNGIRRKITEGPFAPLSERTLAARRRRGHMGTSPLIDSGQLRAAATFVIRYE